MGRYLTSDDRLVESYGVRANKLSFVSRTYKHIHDLVKLKIPALYMQRILLRELESLLSAFPISSDLPFQRAQFLRVEFLCPGSLTCDSIYVHDDAAIFRRPFLLRIDGKMVVQAHLFHVLSWHRQFYLRASSLPISSMYSFTTPCRRIQS